MVHRVAQRFKNRCNNTSISYLDLVQEGTIGLIIAYSRFNPKRNVRFSTYANYWIEAKIRRFLDRHSSTMHVTYSASAIYNNLVKRYGNGRDGTTQDMITRVQADYASGDLSYRDYIRFISILLAKSPERHNHLAIDMPTVVSGSSGDMTVTTDSSPLAAAIHKATACHPETERDLSQKSLIDGMLNKLDKEEQDIVIMYYGLRGSPSHTYEKLADKMKCSKQRIHQQHKKIVNKLRLYLKEIGLSDKIDPREFLE